MQGTSLTKQERECKLYDEFDKFAYKKGESLRQFYLRFLLILNDMNFYNMKLEQFQVNIKFLNTLPPEWSKFVTDVKLVRDLHTTNIDQLHAYLGQHEFHANEVHLMHERNLDPLALVATHQMTQSPYQSSQYGSHTQSSTPLLITYLPNDFQSSVYHNVYIPSSSIPQVKYAPSVNQQPDFSQPDSGLIILVFQKGDDPIDAINHMMSFLTVVNVITHNATYQADDLDAYDSDCDEINTNKVALMVNLSHIGFDDLAESNIVNQSETEITSDSNIIPYSYYLEPKLYDGSVIQKTNAIVICDSKETLMLAEESRSKMLLKQKDSMMSEKKVNTKPVDYTALNQLSQDFKTRFVPQTELSAEQVFWSQNSMNSEEPNLSTRSTQVEVLKELPKVSMLNTSLKKFKHHLASFDAVVKERTTATTIIEGTRGFKQTKSCFRDEIIPFVKAISRKFSKVLVIQYNRALYK
nr:hypothetical protein [Tanacetum cinerariifolium]